MARQHKRGIPRTQTALLPPTIEDYAGAQSVARVIDEYVTGLDMMALGFARSVAKHKPISRRQNSKPLKRALREWG